MNSNYYQNPTFPTQGYQTPPNNISINEIKNNQINLPEEQSYIENILRLNKGMRANVYVSYADSNEWRDKVYSGIIEEAGRDHLIISDPSNGNWYLLRMIYIDYVEFMEKINYSHNYSEKNY